MYTSIILQLNGLDLNQRKWSLFFSARQVTLSKVCRIHVYYLVTIKIVTWMVVNFFFSIDESAK